MSSTLSSSTRQMLTLADLGQAVKQATNWTAIGMFGVFVGFTPFITTWAAARTKSTADLYTAGDGITGFQDGLALAGDCMSAASLPGISAAAMASGCEGLTYSIGSPVGGPVITFLMAERFHGVIRDEVRAMGRRIEAVRGCRAAADAVDPALWLRVDSHSLLQAMLYLAGRLVEEHDRHDGAFWFERERVRQQSLFCLLLALDESREQLDAAQFVRGEGRPEAHDFDPFANTGHACELADRRLEDLAYSGSPPRSSSS